MSLAISRWDWQICHSSRGRHEKHYDSKAHCLWFCSEIKILKDLMASFCIIVFYVSMTIYCRSPISEENRNKKHYPRQLCAQSVLCFSGEHKGEAHVNCSFFFYFRQGKAAVASSFSNIKDVSLRNNCHITWKLGSWWQRREVTQLSHL